MIFFKEFYYVYVCGFVWECEYDCQGLWVLEVLDYFGVNY